MSKVLDGVIEFAIGDAMGVPIEFSNREKCLVNPLTEMIGFGSHQVPAGSWSDDTSMTIATMDSIIQNKTIDYKDIMNKFCDWAVDYKYTPTNFRFDIGHTCAKAIYNYSKKGSPPLECGLDDINSNGNGSLMRMLPIALYSYYKKLNEKEIQVLTNNVSSLTHAHEISKLGCYIYVRYVLLLLGGKDKYSAYSIIRSIDYSYYSEETIHVYDRILKEELTNLKLDDIKSSGYIVDTLEASLWVLLNTNTFAQSIIGAINLGNDTDTIGAITGSMAGILYGYDSFPKKWTNKLIKIDYLKELCNNFSKVIVEEKTTDKYNLERFISIQKDEYDVAFDEIKNGKKISHWMWYIFPQLTNLGYSSTAKYYGIKNKEEAKAYLANEYLKKNLIKISEELLKLDCNISDILGYPDDLKLKSCMTLFNFIDPSISVFENVLKKFYNGEKDNNTISILENESK